MQRITLNSQLKAESVTSFFAMNRITRIVVNSGRIGSNACLWFTAMTAAPFFGICSFPVTSGLNRISMTRSSRRRIALYPRFQSTLFFFTVLLLSAPQFLFLKHAVIHLPDDRLGQFSAEFPLSRDSIKREILAAQLQQFLLDLLFVRTFLQDDERTYDPEYNWNYEVGTKTSFFDHALQMELTLFYVDWRHQQITQTVPGVGNITRNAGHSDSKGVELSLIARPVQPLTLRLSYGYTYARFLDYQKSETVSYTGNMLPLVPRHTLSLNGSYTITPRQGIMDRLVLSVGLNGMGKIYWNEDNLVSQRFYALLNAKASATFGPVTWELWGKNLTDTDYLTYYFKASAAYGQKGRPVSFGTSLIFDI